MALLCAIKEAAKEFQYGIYTDVIDVQSLIPFDLAQEIKSSGEN